ncbi:MAG: orotate phosphoribosyltransferase, partial [Pseudomonadota bacterium]
TLKSGRRSPYFFNSGLFNTGGRLAALGRFYAAAIAVRGLEFDMLYGPAYKGIPLVATTAIALADHHAVDRPYTFNRKEAKDHGEGGELVGASPAGRALIVDDVISAGTSARESVDLLRAAGAEPSAMAIALDRQERGRAGKSAVQEVADDLGLEVVAIAGLDTLLEFVDGHPDVRDWRDAIAAYRSEYGT